MQPDLLAVLSGLATGQNFTLMGAAVVVWKVLEQFFPALRNILPSAKPAVPVAPASPLPALPHFPTLPHFPFPNFPVPNLPVNLPIPLPNVPVPVPIPGGGAIMVNPQEALNVILTLAKLLHEAQQSKQLAAPPATPPATP